MRGTWACCAQRSRSALLASASASAFHFRGPHEIPDVGKLLDQGARFRVQGSDVLLANLRAAVHLVDHELRVREHRMRWIPRLRASLSPSMRARYSAIPAGLLDPAALQT